MKRWLLILLMWVLPLQLSFAAAAPYCACEDGGAAQHVGHHSHDHQDGKGQGEHPSTLPGADTGCDYCQHAGSAALPLPSPALLYMPQQYHLEGDPGGFVSFIPDLVPPPDRASLA